MVRAAWDAAVLPLAPDHPPFVAALRRLGAAARRDGVTLGEALKALDRIAVRSSVPRPESDRVRQQASGHVIEAYYAW